MGLDVTVDLKSGRFKCNDCEKLRERVEALEKALRTLADAHLTRAAELVRLAPEPFKHNDREGIDRETVCGEWLTRVKADCRDARAALAGEGERNG